MCNGLSIQRRLSLPTAPHIDRIACEGAKPMFVSLRAAFGGSTKAVQSNSAKQSAALIQGYAESCAVSPQFLESTGLRALVMRSAQLEERDMNRSFHESAARLFACPYCSTFSVSSLLGLITSKVNSTEWSLEAIGHDAAASFLQLATNDIVRRLHKMNRESSIDLFAGSPQSIRAFRADAVAADITSINQLLHRSADYLRQKPKQQGDERSSLAMRIAALRYFAATLQPNEALRLIDGASAGGGQAEMMMELAMATCADPDIPRDDGSGGGMYRTLACRLRWKPKEEPPSLMQVAHVCNSVGSITELAESHKIFMDALSMTEQGYSIHNQKALATAVDAFHGAVSRHGPQERHGALNLMQQLWKMILRRSRGDVLQDNTIHGSLVLALCAVGDPVGAYRIANHPSAVLDVHALWAMHAAQMDCLESAWISGRHKPTRSCVVSCVKKIAAAGDLRPEDAAARIFALLSLCRQFGCPVDAEVVGVSIDALARLALAVGSFDAVALCGSIRELHVQMGSGPLPIDALASLEDLWVRLAIRDGDAPATLAETLRRGSEGYVKQFATYCPIQDIASLTAGGNVLVPLAWLRAIGRSSKIGELHASQSHATDLVHDVVTFACTFSPGVILSPQVSCGLLRAIAFVAASAPSGRELRKCLLESKNVLFVDSLQSAQMRQALAASDRVDANDQSIVKAASTSDCTRSFWGSSVSQIAQVGGDLNIFGSWYPMTAAERPIAAAHSLADALSFPIAEDQLCDVLVQI